MYITLYNMSGGFLLLAAGYGLALLVHIITILKVTAISYITRRWITAGLEELHVGQIHVPAAPRKLEEKLEITEC